MGPQAGRIDELWRLMLYTTGAVYVVVMIALLAAAFRPRGGDRGETALTPEAQPDQGRERRMSRVVIGGVAATAMILIVFLLASFFTGRKLYAIASSQDMTVEVTGQQWWWSVRYASADPSRIVTTANEIHIPTGQTVHFRLT